MSKIVTIGGGNGQTISLRALRSLEPLPDITAIVTVFDSGGSSGRLRKETGILPPGDLLRALLSLSSFDYPTLRKIFYTYRFSAPLDLAGHSLGNLLINFLHQQNGDFLETLNIFGQALNIKGRVLPVSLDRAELVLELGSGERIFGEYQIGSHSYSVSEVRQRLYLEPPARVLPQVKTAIETADFIILGPGDLFTSILPNLLVEGVTEAVREAPAKLVYILNSANRSGGETSGFKASDYLAEFRKYLDRDFDYIIVQALPEQIAFKYGQVGWEAVFNDLTDLPSRVIAANLELRERVGTNWQKLADVLRASLTFE